MKKFSKIIVVLAVIIAILAVGKNVIVKTIVEKGVHAATGLPLKIKKLNIGILSTNIGIKELSVLNPDGFPKEAMFHAPEIYIDYKLGAMVSGKVHLEEIRLNFDRFVIVKNEQGQSNLEALKPKPKDGDPKEKDKDSKKGKAPKIQIDKLVLKIGKVIFKDYSGGGDPSIKEYKINISEEINDVTNPELLLGFIAMKAMTKAQLNNLIDMDFGVLDMAGEAPKQVIDSIKNTADTLKSKIKLPFGN